MSVTTCHTLVSMSTVGDRIREAREARGWTQAHLAEMIGAPSDSIVKQWEGRAELPTRATRYLSRFEHVLDIQLEEAPAEPSYDPPVSRAPDALLIAEIARRMAARLSPTHDQSNVASFEIAGMTFDSQEGDAEVHDGPA